MLAANETVAQDYSGKRFLLYIVFMITQTQKNSKAWFIYQ